MVDPSQGPGQLSVRRGDGPRQLRRREDVRAVLAVSEAEQQLAVQALLQKVVRLLAGENVVCLSNALVAASVAAIAFFAALLAAHATTVFLCMADIPLSNGKASMSRSSFEGECLPHVSPGKATSLIQCARNASHFMYRPLRLYCSAHSASHLFTVTNCSTIVDCSAVHSLFVSPLYFSKNAGLLLKYVFCAEGWLALAPCSREDNMTDSCNKPGVELAVV